MVHVDLGITGAKRQSWRKANPREILRRLVEDNPHAGMDELFAKFRKVLAKAEDEMQETVDRYYFDNNVRSLQSITDPGSGTRKAASRERAEALRKKVEENIATAIQQKAQRILLDAIMPNEKPLRDCTGQECNQMGGWLAGIGAKLKADQKVGEKFNEDQIQSHWTRSAARSP
jgi:type I site-specific restriction endonuclease